MTAVNLNTVFGSEHSWDELRALLVKLLRRKFPGAVREDVEDAAADAVLDLCDYWAGLSSSMSDDVDRNWNYAKWRATRRAASALYRDIQDRSVEVSMEQTVRTGDGDSSITVGDLLATKEARPSEMTDEEYQERVERFIAAIPQEDLRDWLNPMVEGESCRRQAQRTGENYVAVHRKRQRGKARLLGLAQQHGLRVA